MCHEKRKENRSMARLMSELKQKLEKNPCLFMNV